MYGQTDDTSSSESWKLSLNNIELSIVWTVSFDTSGLPKDTTLTSKSFYDERGLETETQFRFRNDDKDYYWIRYFYNDSGFRIDYETSAMILDGEYVKNPPAFTICNRYEKGNMVESMKYFSEDPETIAERKMYEYNDMDLLVRIEKYIHENLIEVTLIDYIKRID